MSRNQRLADALVRKGLTAGQLAAEMGHNPKTVERWISGGQVPYPRSRERLARVLDAPVALLFPELASSFGGSDELVGLYATRAEVPVSLIATLVSEATRHIDVCAYAATWLWDSIPAFANLLAERSAAGAAVRVCLGDPASEEDLPGHPSHLQQGPRLQPATRGLAASGTAGILLRGCVTRRCHRCSLLPVRSRVIKGLV
jgi:transcriptional regulator with XRE-family HTH domain